MPTFHQRLQFVEAWHVAEHRIHVAVSEDFEPVGHHLAGDCDQYERAGSGDGSSEVRSDGWRADRRGFKYPPDGCRSAETTTKLNRMNRAQAGGSAVAGVAAGAGSTGLVRGVGEAAEGAARKTGLLKTALSGVVDFLGGPVGIAIGGVTTALSLAGSAISSYNDAAAHTQSVNRTVADSFKNVQSGCGGRFHGCFQSQEDRFEELGRQGLWLEASERQCRREAF